MELSDEMNLLDEDIDKTLHIKGQMFYMEAWECLLFLACPMMKVNAIDNATSL